MGGSLIMGPAELSAYLGVPRSWIYNQTRRGRNCAFPFLKLGRYVRFSKSDIDKWLDGQRRGEQFRN